MVAGVKIFLVAPSSYIKHTNSFFVTKSVGPGRENKNSSL